MVEAFLSKACITVFGLLFPAYSSYKAIKAASFQEYVRWIMYWIVFSLFTVVEMFTDILFSWLPFYYLSKIVIVLWLAMPYTKGSTFVYRKIIHPNFNRNEHAIDKLLEEAKRNSYKTAINVGSKGLSLAANLVVNAAVKGQAVVSEKWKSYSTMDLRTLPDDINVHSNKIGHRNYNQNNFSSESNMLKKQYDSYSMYNLSENIQNSSSTSAKKFSSALQSPIKEELSDQESSEHFDSRPPSHTFDDMTILNRTNYAKESLNDPYKHSDYSRTLPRSTRSLRNKEKPMPPMPHFSHKTKEVQLRRSKRLLKSEDLLNDLSEE